MKTIRYAVLAIGHEWRIVTEHRQLGHFSSRGRAFEAALRFAQQAQGSGRPVEILYTDDGGEVRAFHLPGMEMPSQAEPPQRLQASA